MAYGKKYQVDFDSLKGAQYHLEIHEKDYAGAVLNRLGSASPVVHKWNTDEPKPPIKGSALDITLVNEKGNLPLSSFYSTDDDTFLVKFFHGTDLKFMGYIVQDDCSEIKIDASHLINLTVTDNLGLLKDVSLYEAARLMGVTNIYTMNVEGTAFLSGWIWLIHGLPTVAKDDTITFNGTPHDGTYVVLHTLVNGFGQTLVFTQPTLPSAFTTVSATITIITPTNLLRRMPLAEIINLCLHGTNLSLATNVYAKIKPVGGLTGRWLDDTYLDGATFLNGETYEDCYQVLETILGRFKATLFQANGVWNIIRWDELRQYSNLIEGFSYTSSMVYNATITLNDVFTAGIGEDTVAETGLEESILRPYRYTKETFEYKQPAQLIKNVDFSKLGNLITTYADGANTVSEYEMKDWELGYDYTTGGGGYIANNSSSSRFIRVIQNAVGEEIERYGVIKGVPSFSRLSVAQSNSIEVSEGDRVEISLDLKTNVSQAGAGFVTTIVQIVTTNPPTPRSANNRRLNSQGQWFAFGAPQPPGIAWNLNIPVGDNTNQWHTMSVGFTEGVPHAGLLTLKLAQAVITPNANSETHYKNISFSVKQSISGQGNIIGHTHTDTQQKNISNREEKDLLVDSSPSNAINGTLFLATFTGALQARTQFWQRGALTPQKLLGNITTFDELFWRRVQRKKLEGALYGLIQDHHLSILTLIRYNYFTDSNFIWGQCEIDYRRDKVSGTLWEMWVDGEADPDLLENYVFRYLYEKDRR